MQMAANQEAHVIYFDDTNHKWLTTDVVEISPEEECSYTTAQRLKNLFGLGYQVVSDAVPERLAFNEEIMLPRLFSVHVRHS